MSYDTVAAISQVTSLLMFMSMFAGVIAYVMWPGNKRRFETAQKRALDLGQERSKTAERDGGLS